MVFVCNGSCSQFKIKRRWKVKLYEMGASYCGSCSVFLKYDGKYCPCCKAILRTRPRGGWPKTKELKRI